MRTIASIAAICAALSNVVHAEAVDPHQPGDVPELSAEQLVQSYKSDNEAAKMTAIFYADGLHDGLDYANAYLHVNNRTRVYCPPADYKASATDDILAIESYIDIYPDKSKYPASSILIAAKTMLFPCDAGINQ